MLFTLKVKEQQHAKDKVVAGVGTFAGILMSLGILFKVMHWPGANMMCAVALGIVLFVFLPIYFFAGIRNPQTKVNTVVSSVLLFAGCALVLILVRAPGGTKKDYVAYTDYFLRNERIVQSEAQLLAQMSSDPSTQADGLAISQLCDEIKTFLVESETGLKRIDRDFEKNGTWISETYAQVYWSDAPEQAQKLQTLQKQIERYNQAHKNTVNFDPIALAPTALDPHERVRTLLNNLSQVQLMVLQNQRRLLASR